MKLQEFRTGFGRIVTGIGYLALVALFAMTIVVAVDVVLRKISGGSLRINGSNELTGFLMVVVCSLYIPVLQIRNGHIWVPLFVNKFKYRFRCFWLFAIRLVETALVVTLAIGGYRKVLDMYSTGRSSDVLHLPYWIFAVAIVVAFVEFFVLSLVDTIKLFSDGVINEPPVEVDDRWSEDDVKGL